MSKSIGAQLERARKQGVENLLVQEGSNTRSRPLLVIQPGVSQEPYEGLQEMQARRWVAEELRLDPDVPVNLFETTIRILGGLLATFHLSNGDKVMLYKAASLALRLLPAFSTKTGALQ